MVYWKQITTSDILLSQEAGNEFQANPHNIKAMWLERDFDHLCAGVKDNLMWFVNSTDIDLGISKQRIMMFKRWATAKIPLVGNATEEIAQVISVITNDGNYKYYYDLTLSDSTRPTIEAVQLSDDECIINHKTITL